MGNNTKPKKYIIVTNDKYELIVAMGTLKEIQETSKFTIAQIRSALAVNRNVIGLRKEYKFFEDKGEENE